MFLLPFCKDCAIIYGFISFSKKFLHMVSNSTGILKKTTAKPADLITTARYSAVVGAHTSRPRFLAVMHPPRNCINPEKHSQISTGMRRNELLHVFRRAKDGGGKKATWLSTLLLPFQDETKTPGQSHESLGSSPSHEFHFHGSNSQSFPFTPPPRGAPALSGVISTPMQLVKG